MAARVTGAEVKEIIKTSLIAAEIDPFIIPANLIVTNNLASSSLGTDTLKEIERWLSAHFLATSNFQRQLKSQKVDDAAESYAGKFDMNLQFTQYGQMALTLDTTGALANLGKTPAKIEVLFDPEGTA